MDIDPRLVAESLDYEPESGVLRWRVRPLHHFKDERICKAWNTRRAGTVALSAITKFGYREGLLFAQNVKAHRAAWVCHYGVWPDVIDHVNGVRSDNRLCNLRNVSHMENRRNQGIPRHNTSGVLGVSWNKQSCKWAAIITIGGKNILLGRFAKKEDAVIARREADVRYGFHENHGDKRREND